MKRRIFVAINLPQDIKKSLAKHEANWPDLPIRWVKIDNLHITLVFLGYLRDEDLLGVSEISKGVSQRNASFSIRLNKICYGPPNKIPPRMVWAEGEKSESLSNLKKDLEDSLLERVSFHKESRAFTPHITLGRIRGWEWKKINPEERPKVNENIDLIFSVNSIEVMESILKRGGVEYTVLESLPLIQD